MTVDEARILVSQKKEVTIQRSAARWTGVATGVFTRPAIRLEQVNGEIVVVVLEGADVVEDS